MKWQIKYYSSKLEEEILSLPDGLLARYLRLTDLMFEFGSNLGMPHTRPLDGGLFELRVKSSQGFLLYENREENHYASLFCQKISKDSKKKLRLAKTRMSEVIKDDTF